MPRGSAQPPDEPLAAGTSAPTISLLAGAVCVGLGAVVLLGWALDLTLLKGVLPGLPSMKAMTAVALVLLGASMLLYARSPDPVAARGLPGALALAAAAIGMTALIEYVFGDLGIDTLLFADTGTYPGRPSPHTASGLAVAGVALATVRPDQGWRQVVHQGLVVTLAGVVVAALVGYAYGVDFLRGVSSTTGMSIHTTLAFGLLCAGIAALRPGRGIGALFSADRPSSVLARRLAPAVILVPLVLSLLRIKGEEAGLYDLASGVALMTFGTIILLFGLVWLTGRSLDEAEEARSRAEQEIVQSREELRLSEERLRSITESVNDAVVAVDDGGKITFWNDCASQVFGYEKSEALGMDLTALMPERLRASHLRAFEANASGGPDRLIGKLVELEGLRRSGDEFPLELSLSRWERGGRRFYTAAIRDITERKRADHEKMRLATIVESSDDAIFETTLDGAIISWNAGAERMYGYCAEEVIGKRAALLMPGERQDEGTQLLGRVQRGERIRDHETQRLRKDGTTIEVSLTVSPVHDTLGAVVGAAAIGRDITERKRAADETLRETVRRLERSNADLERFAYAASHDLSEPLRVIAGFVQLLAKRYEGQLDEHADELIQSTVAGVERMQALIDGLLEYSRVRRVDLVPVQVDCTKLVKQVLEGLRRSIEEKGGTVTVRPLPPVAAEPVLMGQLFQNLVSNALKFSDDGRAEVEISAERDGTAWVFAVRDNGVGIEPRHAERIFDMFQRLHSRAYPGTGIGLAICKRIVERHGGRIWIEPAAGGGTIFKFTIPDRKDVAG